MKNSLGDEAGTADDCGGDLAVDSGGALAGRLLAATAGDPGGDGGRPWRGRRATLASRKKSLADSGADDSTDDSGGGRRGRARTSLLL